MLTSGDVVELDLGAPVGSEAGFAHPAVVVTAQSLLEETPRVLQVVPLTSTWRRFRSEVLIVADADNGLDHDSAAQCQHIRAVASQRVGATRGNVGPIVLAQLRDTLGVILDLPV